MDLATIIGLVLAFGLCLAAILLGGSIIPFIDIPSLLIVVGGTIGAGLINYPMGHMVSAVGIAKHAILHKPDSPQERIAMMVEFSNKARREGVLSLESELERVTDKFMITGLQLVVDGQETQALNDILRTEIDFLMDRHKSGADIFTTLAAFAPALGLIGTLIGLVQMLQSMDDPSSIGPAMAVALLTTFYGAVLANLIFTPIAGKLKTRSSSEVLLRELTLEGIVAIASGDNPRLVEQKLQAYLPPKLRKTEEG
jgi:chemotaxis protein MotA